MRDDNESIASFEPLMVSAGSPHRAVLNDLAVDLAAQAEGFQSSLPQSIALSLAELIRSMNCYYSNLIEGHNTHPIDIERALSGDYSSEPEKRNLQLEAKAHIAVQKWIDEDGLTESPTSLAMIQEIHRRFCEQLPPEFLYVEIPSTNERVQINPGEVRKRDVQVGKHVAISAGAIPRFMERFNEAYSKLGRIESILAAGCAHHRLLWIHPFLDGNGRTARLMSYAMLRDALNTRGLWSVARGLARQEIEYKKHLQACDEERQGDRDGRGTLSEAALASFTEFFLQTCIDQIKFMRDLMKPAKLSDRIMIWAEEEMRAGRLAQKSDYILRVILYKGELERGEVSEIMGVSDRTARRATAALIESGALKSGSSRAPLLLAFPATLAGRWMPGLFPEI
ncbi:Fic family protein [Methylophaga sp. OBS4]|uniref:Fic family protein n=1 Tax=Methylophaga sp. OBS4 TaxID=2991935 RepID=UPI00225C3589|nr:Fic family protein [Methylophaga sp. OBS4]MCX4187918.1 Fic family protein [Methylophaga sp. OBS4]